MVKTKDYHDDVPEPVVESFIEGMTKNEAPMVGLMYGVVLAYALQYNDEKGICLLTDFLVVGENQQTFDLEGDNGCLIMLEEYVVDSEDRVYDFLLNRSNRDLASEVENVTSDSLNVIEQENKGDYETEVVKSEPKFKGFQLVKEAKSVVISQVKGSYEVSIAENDEKQVSATLKDLVWIVAFDVMIYVAYFLVNYLNLDSLVEIGGSKQVDYGCTVNIHVLMALAAFASVFMENSLEGGLLIAMFNLAHIVEKYFTGRSMGDVRELKETCPNSTLVLDVDKNDTTNFSSLSYKKVPVTESKDEQFRRKLAWKAFLHVAAYDSAVSEWLWNQTGGGKFSPSFTVPLSLKSSLQYGENPHQNADDIIEAYRLAVKADPVSALGGIVAFNVEVYEADVVKFPELFYGPHLKVVFMGSVLFALQLLFGINVVFYFSSSMFKSAEAPSDTANMFVAIVNLSGPCNAPMLMDKLGWKVLFLGSFLGMAVALGLQVVAARSFVSHDTSVYLYVGGVLLVVFPLGAGPVPKTSPVRKVSNTSKSKSHGLVHGCSGAGLFIEML